jgi:hypothetical protein
VRQEAFKVTHATLPESEASVSASEHAVAMMGSLGVEDDFGDLLDFGDDEQYLTQATHGEQQKVGTVGTAPQSASNQAAAHHHNAGSATTFCGDVVQQTVDRVVWHNCPCVGNQSEILQLSDVDTSWNMIRLQQEVDEQTDGVDDVWAKPFFSDTGRCSFM